MIVIDRGMGWLVSISSARLRASFSFFFFLNLGEHKGAGSTTGTNDTRSLVLAGKPTPMGIFVVVLFFHGYRS